MIKKERWCRRGDLNPHGGYPPPPQDGVSTNSTTSAKLYRIVALAFIANEIPSSSVNENATNLSLEITSAARAQATEVSEEPLVGPGLLKVQQEPPEPAFPS